MQICGHGQLDLGMLRARTQVNLTEYSRWLSVTDGQEVSRSFVQLPHPFSGAWVATHRQLERFISWQLSSSRCVPAVLCHLPEQSRSVCIKMHEALGWMCCNLNQFVELARNHLRALIQDGLRMTNHIESNDLLFLEAQGISQPPSFVWFGCPAASAHTLSLPGFVSSA